MIVNDFKYYKPSTQNELFSILTNLDGDCRFLAGGTDLIQGLKDGSIVTGAVVDLKALDLNAITADKGGLIIDANVTMADLIFSKEINEQYPAICDAAKKMATPAVRQRATIGGNLCNASPSADSAPPLLVYEAKAVLQGAEGSREVLLEDFFTGPGRNCLKKDEVFVSIKLPSLPGGNGAAYVKHSRTSKDLALTGVATYLELEGQKCLKCKIALGAVGAIPFRALKAEKIIEGQDLTDELIDMAAKQAVGEAKPIDDLRATADYRRDMVFEMTRRAIKAAQARIMQL